MSISMLRTELESILEKGKALPNGTIRTHGGRKVIKQDGKWVGLKSDKGRNVASINNKKGKQTRMPPPPLKKTKTKSKSAPSSMNKLGKKYGYSSDDVEYLWNLSNSQTGKHIQVARLQTKKLLDKLVKRYGEDFKKKPMSAWPEKERKTYNEMQNKIDFLTRLRAKK